MKTTQLTIIFIFLFSISFSQKEKLDQLFNKTDLFMSMNVTNGLVDYAGLSENKLALEELIVLTNSIKVESVKDKNYRKSFLINAYNLFVIKGVIDNYPVKSPMEIPGFFKQIKYQAGDLGEVTLNELETNLNRKVYKDPRVHFVLVCGGNGCPPIIDEAYMPSKLEKQLENQTTIALNDPSFIQVTENKVLLSEIFKWYPEDFRIKGKNELDYINQFRTNKIDRKSKIGHYPYDWSLNGQKTMSVQNSTNKESVEKEPTDNFNLQTYNAGSLLTKGQYDLTLFNSLYTQSESEWMGIKYSGFRETFASSLIQYTYGITKNARINLGFDIKLASSGRASVDDKFSNISRAFAFKNNDSTRVGIASVGARVKIQPFKSVTNFTMQSSLLISPTAYAEGRAADENGNGGLYFLEWDRIQWWNQFFYTKSFNKSQLFFELDVWYRIGYKKDNATALDLPTTVIYSYFPNSKTTIYGLVSHLLRNQYNPNNYDDGITSAANYTSAGLGFKYQLTPSLNLELLYSDFLRGKNSGLGNTFSFGLRYVH
ncbi:DUF547 domain-containing protein [Flavobacteriales bacterium]|nr:DUF547 domain-containing protein [Flavobacteriales bacterium]